jgi:hypothetical protein
MDILIIYNEQLKAYAYKIADSLKSSGYAVYTLDVKDYTGNQSITAVPTFLIRKGTKEGYMIKGKQPLNFILEWAKNSGARDN